MKSKVISLCLLLMCMAVNGQCPDTEDEETRAQAYITQLDIETAAYHNKLYIALFNHAIDPTDENDAIVTNASLASAAASKKALEVTSTYNWTTYENATLQRMFRKYLQDRLGREALPEDKYERLLDIRSYMINNYASATVCDYNNRTKCDLVLEPDLIDIFASNQVPEELEYYWIEWHKAAGTKIKSNYTEYVTLSNEAAVLSNYTSYAEYWIAAYQVSNFEEQINNIFETVKPLYQQLHAYVRRLLREKYGEDVVSAKGPIPGHLFGDIWGSTWMYLESLGRPYPDKAPIDLTASLKEKNYTVLNIVEKADEFFQSLNLSAVSESFWNKSVFVKPENKNMLCHATAWDMADGKDFRMSVCAEVNADYFQIIHHEMGHVQYFMQYAGLPDVLRGGANPGFQEAIGDTIALSAVSPTHLQTIGLIEATESDYQTEINQLFKVALDKVAFLPFALMLETFRYGVFRGNTTADNYNCHYYRLKEKYQGMQPPVNRTEDDFDAGAKYHVAADAEYAEYFVAYALQFQFHRALCEIAGQYDSSNSSSNLSNCDIYKSVDAGNKFGAMLKLGQSVDWPDAMEVLTGQRDMTGDGIVEYFKPLYDWLVAENNRTGEYIGWESSTTQFCTAEQLAALGE